MQFLINSISLKCINLNNSDLNVVTLFVFILYNERHTNYNQSYICFRNNTCCEINVKAQAFPGFLIRDYIVTLRINVDMEIETVISI